MTSPTKQLGGGRCSLCSKPGHNKRTCKNKKPNKVSKPETKTRKPHKLTLGERKRIMLSQIQSYVAQEQLKKIKGLRKKQQKYAMVHPGPARVIAKMDKIIEKLEIRIQNLPKLPVSRVRASRRKKNTFSVLDIMIDPVGNHAIYTMINSVYATPAYVKIAETESKDNVDQWISNNAHKYSM